MTSARNPSRNHAFKLSGEKDRRVEKRFISKQNVIITLEMEGCGWTCPGKAYEIGKTGLRLKLDVLLELGLDLEISFPSEPAGVLCLGRVSWSRKSRGRYEYEAGIAVREWLSVTDGALAWVRIMGKTAKIDRRRFLIPHDL